MENTFGAKKVELVEFDLDPPRWHGQLLFLIHSCCLQDVSFKEEQLSRML